MTFGERIATRRKNLRLSRQHLAERVGTSAPVIGRYERDEISPSVETAQKIASALEVTVDYLLGEDHRARFDQALLDRIEALDQLPRPDKEKIYYFIDVVVRDAKARAAYAA